MRLGSGRMPRVRLDVAVNGQVHHPLSNVPM